MAAFGPLADESDHAFTAAAIAARKLDQGIYGLPIRLPFVQVLADRFRIVPDLPDRLPQRVRPPLSPSHTTALTGGFRR